MRLWHKDLIPLLPTKQLVSQWRELNVFYNKYENFIIVRYMHEYDRRHLKAYSNLIIEEFKKRNYKIRNYENYNRYFENTNEILEIEEIFKNHHNFEYLEICVYNLKEKYIRGQKDFTTEEWNNILNKYYFEKKLDSGLTSAELSYKINV